MKSIKNIGAPWFLNTKPMIDGFLKDPLLRSSVHLQLDLPWESEQKLLNGEVELALIPSIEFAKKSSKYELVPSCCISADIQVKSVNLFFNESLNSIKSVAVDSSSRTSVILMQIILREKFGITPQLVTMPPDLSTMLKNADAALLIGDPALKGTLVSDHYLDLAEEWVDMTNLPFVFAVWAAKRNGSTANDVLMLNKSLEIGLKNRERIASDFYQQAGWGPSADFFRIYLENCIRYEFNAEAEAGLTEFFRLAFMLGFLEDIPEIRKTGDEQTVYPGISSN